jgi:hypothetical protein
MLFDNPDADAPSDIDSSDNQQIGQPVAYWSNRSHKPSLATVIRCVFRNTQPVAAELAYLMTPSNPAHTSVGFGLEPAYMSHPTPKLLHTTIIQTVDGNEYLTPKAGTTIMDDRDRQILDFEGRWWRYAGNKETEIVRRFEMSAIRYTQKLNQVLDDPEALAHYPILVNRLRRLRNQRITARAARKAL